MGRPVIRCSVEAKSDEFVLTLSGIGSCTFDFPLGTAPQLMSHDFAAWAALPIAMRTGSDLHICGQISERVRVSVERVSNIWEKWVPYHFQRVRVTADEVIDIQPSGDR